MTTIQEAIADQTKGVEKDQVEELVLDKIRIGKFSDAIRDSIEAFTNLQTLSLNECEIVSLENFPRLHKLLRIELFDNKITGSQLPHLLHLVNL